MGKCLVVDVGGWHLCAALTLICCTNEGVTLGSDGVGSHVAVDICELNLLAAQNFILIWMKNDHGVGSRVAVDICG